ncbi:MAG TPA: histidine kinase [Anaerolineales bacterium]|nr:histidine kinase [Anaerolineales bacterium]
MNTQTESPTRLYGRWLLNARLAWLLFTLTCILSTLSFVFLALSWATPVPDTWGFRGDAMLLALAFGGIGLLLARRHPQNPIGWLLLLAGLINSILEFCVEYATYALLTKPGELPYGTLAAWIASWLWVIGIAILIYVFLLFPTGHLPSARWRPVAWFFVGAFGLLTFVFMIRPGPLYFAPYLDNPFAVQVAYRVLSPIPVATAAAVFFVGISVILRLRRAEGVERQQLKWFAYAATLRAIFGMSESVAEAVGLKGTDPKFYEYLSVALWIAIAVAIAFAILRYRLWDIDIIINRTLVYGALSASVVAFYVLIVGWLSIGLQTQNYLPASVFAILVIAFLFQPLRQRLQGIADRFVPVPQSALPVEQHEYKIASPEVEGAADTTLHGHGLFIARDILGPNQEIAASQPNSERWFMLAHVAWIVCAVLALLIFLAAIPLGYVQRFSGTFGVPIDAPGWYIAVMSVAQAVVSMLTALVCLALAALLFWKRRQEPMTLVVSFFLLAYGILLAGPLEALNGLPLMSAAPPSHRSVVISADAILQIQTALFAVMPLLFYLFPNGRFVPGWTRYPALLLLLLVPVTIRTFSVDWPLTVTLFTWSYAALWGVGIYAQIYRYRRVASPLERQQTKWVVFGVVLTFIILAVLQIPYIAATSIPAGVTHPWWQPLTGLGWFLTLMILPLSLALAVMRYRLWDIDILINRSLVYGALIVSVIGLYMIVVGVAGALFQAVGNTLLAILATGLIAVLFQPLRQRLQRGINHLMYGERDDPYVVLSRLGQRLEAAYAPESVLPTIVETVAQTLKLPYVGIALNQDGDFKIAAEFGRSKSEPISLPLIYQGEPVGELILAPRAPGEPFTSSERQLLDDLARQAGVAAHAIRLTTDLQRSRERLVAAREEERRRLRRDLHDGLGPQLAGVALKLETLRNRLTDDPLAASLLADLAKRTQDATADIRHLVYELRPPTLDELGLVMALREGAAQYNQQGANGLNITFEAPESLPPLPAAVEVAVYRITQEALTNVIRHAEARACFVRLSLDKSAGLLCLEVQDDGRGLLTKRRTGVGLNSMRERAEELGGTFTITPVPNGGTHLSARLPCRVIEPARRLDKDALDASKEEI